ncbi:hypothetical protein [Celeribacter litoreus]|uniref:hypothetical protein n=1 Tax=Celeribacter litoreus TaxID=2876714 RepID=UPI001CCEC341|nr:hypothetical protein [Celeribacter litoreus]MCA0045114.1 hypothetical protein [Celeribacter litoreus]
MTNLSKLTVKSVVRACKQDPIQQRRQKLVAGIEEQMKVVEAALRGESFETARKTWGKNEHGEKVLVEKLRKVRPWFFEQDGGWYVQCKYGNKALVLGKGNAVFVKALKDAGAALETLRAAVLAGELDAVIAEAVKRKAA